MPDAPESRRLVDAPRRDQDALRPQGDLSIARLPREADALVDQASPDPEPARLRLDEEQSELRHRFRLRHQEHGPRDLAVARGDPPALPLGTPRFHTLGHDA